MREMFETLAAMCAVFNTNLRKSGFSRREALKLTQTFVEATLNKPTTQSKEENKNG